VETARPLQALLQALAHLGQTLPPEPPADLRDFWQWAISHWQPANVSSVLVRRPPQIG
jgi:hypothetical protein